MSTPSEPPSTPRLRYTLHGLLSLVTFAAIGMGFLVGENPVVSIARYVPVWPHMMVLAALASGVVTLIVALIFGRRQ